MRTLFAAVALAGIVLAANPLQPVRTGYYAPEAGPDDYLVSFWDVAPFDPLVGPARLPAELVIDRYAADGTGYYLVQFAGPVFTDQIDRLARAGGTFLGFHSRRLAFVRMNAVQAEQTRNLPFVRWVGIYQPGFKSDSHTLEEEGFGRVSVTLFYPEDIERAEQDLAAFGCQVVRSGVSEVMKVVEVDCDRALLGSIARLPYVMSVQEWHEPRPENENCQWVVQTWSQNERRVWAKGLFGTDEILGYTDSGLDVNHYAFKDSSVAISDTGEFPNHRKVVVFKHYPPAGGVGDPSGHGTHVAGTIVGNDSVNGGTNLNDGHAKNARIVHLSPIPAPPGNDFTVPLNMITNDLRNPELRPHTLSHSWWTGTMGQYTNAAATFDMFAWKNKDIVLIKSCGNQLQIGQKRITEPGNSKSIIAAAALLNGTSATQLASYSSRGPASDNRVKPDISVPGDGIYSASRNTPNSYVSMSGTSMAAPCVNGSVGLLRSYLRKGYYPSGAARPADTFGYVSAALLKAMVLVSADPNIGSYAVPSEYIGWGRLDMDSVMFFTDSVPDARKLLLYDDTTGLATGQFQEFQFRANAAMPLRVAVVWTDTAAAAGANPCLINDLNCLLTAPTGKFYKGCLYTSGQSTENPGGAYDNLNPNEMFRVNAPDTGLWTMRVEAQNVVTSRQPYAVVVTGGLAPRQPRRDVGATRILAPVGQVDSGMVVVPQAVVENLGDTQETFDVMLRVGSTFADTQSVTLAAGASDTVDFLDWLAETLGVHVVCCSTALAGDDDPANDLAVDSCEVIPLTGVGEEAGVPARFAMDRAVPTPFRSNTTIRFALPVASRVKLGIYNSAGVRVRLLRAGTVAAGFHQARWDGRDETGRVLARGVYYCRFETGDFRAIKKLVKLD